MRDMKKGIAQAIQEYQQDPNTNRELTKEEKELIEYGYIRCSLQVGMDIMTKSESFILGLEQLAECNELLTMFTFEEIKKKLGYDMKKEKEEKESGWAWSAEKDGENWRGIYDTREDAMEEARLEGHKEFYVGECEVVPLDTTLDVDRVMEYLDERYSDESGCDDYIYSGVSQEDRKYLENRLSDVIWAFNKRAGIHPGWFNVISQEHITE